ncbi:unnamed protein product, partial [Ixodes hexagonus]
PELDHQLFFFIFRFLFLFLGLTLFPSRSLAHAWHPACLCFLFVASTFVRFARVTLAYCTLESRLRLPARTQTHPT